MPFSLRKHYPFFRIVYYMSKFALFQKPPTNGDYIQPSEALIFVWKVTFKTFGTENKQQILENYVPTYFDFLLTIVYFSNNLKTFWLLIYNVWKKYFKFFIFIMV